MRIFYTNSTPKFAESWIVEFVNCLFYSCPKIGVGLVKDDIHIESKFYEFELVGKLVV